MNRDSYLASEMFLAVPAHFLPLLMGTKSNRSGWPSRVAGRSATATAANARPKVLRASICKGSKRRFLHGKMTLVQKPLPPANPPRCGHVAVEMALTSSLQALFWNSSVQCDEPIPKQHLAEPKLPASVDFEHTYNHIGNT